MAFPIDRTTLMLRNLPTCLSCQDLVDALHAAGFAGTYDFVYLPIDFRRGLGVGYAFLNVVEHSAAAAIMDMFQGFSASAWSSKSRKVVEVCWSEQQGLSALVERYRNSRMMHKNVPNQFKPMLLSNGMRVPFPEPTRKIRAPYGAKSFA